MFYVMIACDIVAAFMALLWLKPLAARTIAKTERLELDAIEWKRVRAKAEEEKGRELAHV